MGHTAEEKIKILYEDSLKDIQDLTGRMETMTAAFESAAEKVTSGKTALIRQHEYFLNDVNTIKEAVGKIAAQNGAGKADISASVNEILLGETGPMKDLRAISSRFFNTEAGATKWLTKATEKMDQYIWHLFAVGLFGGIAGGIAGGIMVKLLAR